MFDYDDPTKSAEDKMSHAFGCVAIAGIAAIAAALALFAGFVYFCWRMLHG